jgi:hypothetical protein
LFGSSATRSRCDSPAPWMHSRATPTFDLKR